jgi:hypothetical protein
MLVKITGTDRLDGYDQRQHLCVTVESPKAKGALRVHTMSTADRLRVEGTLTLNGSTRTMHAGHAVKNNGVWVGEANNYSWTFESGAPSDKAIALANQVIAEVCRVAESEPAFNWEMMNCEKYYLEIDLERAQEKIEALKLETLAQQTLIAELEQKIRSY